MKVDIQPSELEWRPDGTRTIPLQLRDMSDEARALFMPQPPQHLFHYTSFDGARGIIESKSLRLTKFTYLNDTSEFRHAVRLFRHEAGVVAKMATPEHRAMLDRAAQQLDSFVESNICVASFCEDGDLLSQWRGYGAPGSNVALRFSSSGLSEIAGGAGAQLFKCVYQPLDQLRVVRALVLLLLRAHDIALHDVKKEDQDKLRRDVIGGFNTTFLRVAPVLKDASFAAEREWRLVTLPRKNTDPQYRALVSTARTTTYYLAEFKPASNGRFNFLSGMVLGPTRDFELMMEALWQLCRSNAVDISGLLHSRIPFRG